MVSTTVVNKIYSQKGDKGQTHLAQGSKMSMRLWDAESPRSDKEMHRCDYEAVGYAISGRAELQFEDRIITLEAGDSWVVPEGSLHRYNIIEPFTAVEATA